MPPAIAPTPIEDVRHSRLGIASFVISLAVGVTLLALFIVAGILVRRGSPTNYPGQTVVGAIGILLLAADVVGAGLGLAGICQSRRKRVFAILGTVFSLFTIVGTVSLMVVGIIYATHIAR